MHAGQGRREVCPASGTGRLCGKTNPLTPSAAERLNFPSDRDLFIDSVPMAWWDLSGGGRTRGFEDAPRRIFVWRRRLRRKRICADFLLALPPAAPIGRRAAARLRSPLRRCADASHHHALVMCKDIYPVTVIGAKLSAALRHAPRSSRPAQAGG